MKIFVVLTLLCFGLAFLTVRALDALAGHPHAGFGPLKHAERYGIQEYGPLRYDLKGSCLEAHHLIEQRFSDKVGKEPKDMLSIALTDKEHQRFTNAWRRAIPYGDKTDRATLDQIHGAACRVYRRFPVILEAIKVECPK